MEKQMQRTEISRRLFVALCWIIIGVGIALLSTFYTLFIMSSFHSPQAEYLAWYGLGMLLTGFGVGWATSRQVKIKGYD